MDQDQHIPTDLNGIYLAIGGDVAPTRGRLITKRLDVSGGNAETCFLAAFRELRGWATSAGVDVTRLLEQVTA